MASTPRPVSDSESEAGGRASPSPGRRDDRPGQRVLAVGLDRGGEPQHLGLGVRSVPTTPLTAWLPFVRVPVLSKSTASIVRMRSRASRSLTRMPLRAATAVDSAITSGMARPRACGQAITSTVTVLRTASSTCPSERPDHEGEQRGAGRDVEEGRGEPVGEHLGPAAAGLGLGHEPLDARPARCRRRRHPPGPDRRVGRHRPGDDPVARTAWHGPRLPGDHRLVELGLAVDDDDRRPAPARPDGPARGRRRCSSPIGTRLDRGRRRRRRSASSGSSAASAASAPWAWPMACISCQWPSSMMVTSSGELPPELEVEPAERRGHRCRPRHGDRHGDQQHHARRPVADLRDRPGQERPPAPDEHEGAEHRPDPRHAGQLVAEPLHHHLARQHDGDRQRQAQPEPAAEHRRVVAGVLVVVPVCAVVLRAAPRDAPLLGPTTAQGRSIAPQVEYTPRGYSGPRVDTAAG